MVPPLKWFQFRIYHSLAAICLLYRMDDQQSLDSQSLKDRPWTTDEIRKHSSNWTLAGDVGLFNLLNEFSHNIISRTHEVENAVDSLVHQTKMTSAKINNVINDFHMLSNLQFVENRVYDEEIQEPVPEMKPVTEKTKEQKEAEMLPKIIKAIELGLNVLDTAFDRINVNEISDSEDEEDISSEGRTILEPKDPYEQRPLPYVIGSEEFMKCDYAGLKELVEEEIQSFSEESSLSETDETSSDEGEQLPLDDDDKFSDKQTDQLSQNISDRISSSDESELFGSEKDVNGFASDSSPDLRTKEKNIQRKPSISAQPEKEARQNSVSSLQSKLKLPQVLPVPKLQEKKKEENLFANEEENSEDESPFRKKTGLFSSDIRFDDDEKDGDLFGGDLFGKSPNKDKDVKETKPKPTVDSVKVPPKQPQTTVKTEAKKLTLFDNDEDSEDDIFNSLMKTKKPTLAKTSNASSQDSSEKADTSSTPSSAPSMKPSGNAFDFVTGGGNGDLFGDDSDGEDLFSNKKSSQGKKFYYDASESDDLFGISSKPVKETKVTPQTKPSLFEGSKAPDLPKSEPQKSLLVKKAKDSIFEDSDGSDQEKIVPVEPPLVSAIVKTKTDLSLFDDEDFEDDIFTQTAKKKPESSKVQKEGNLNLFGDESKDKSIKSKSATKEPVSKPSLFSDDSEKVKSIVSKVLPVKKERITEPNLFEDDSEKDESLKSEPVKKDVTKPSLFSDDLEKESPKSVPKKVQPKQPSLFEDSDNFDLFTSKPSVKKADSLISAQVPKPVLDSTKTTDATEVPIVSKIPSSKDIDVDNQISFDAPIDSSNVLNVINKGRAKITTKRRKPTRQGRLAALENSEKEAKTDTTISDLGAVDDSSENLFSAATNSKVQAEPPVLDYKAQEKKKMNLMSQLISEVAISKVGLKKPVEKDEVEEEDEIDIFSETTKDRSKSSFSFLPSEQNGIASVFPVEKKEEKGEALEVSKSDSFDDDFFTEPAFQNFRSSISHKDPVIDLDDDDDDDDLFSAIKTSSLPKAKPDSSDQNDLFDDDTDIFAGMQKEKYEMFPNQMYEDEDDDIFGNLSNTISNKPPSSSKTNNSSVKKVETQQVNAFDDPLTGLLGED